jgi:hypothetical protein
MQWRFWLAIACLSPLAAAPATAQTTPISKQRLFVLTDIENEPDDTQSLIRLLLYSNEIEIEGLVATTSVHMKQRTAPETIRRIIGDYAKVQPNLSKHAPGYPTAAALERLVATGQTAYGMGGVGTGKESEGARRLIAALDRPDPRPLWVTAWGGPNTLAQALHTLRTTRPAAEVRRLVAKLRVYTISDQDDSGPWMRREFPELFYIVSPGGYGAATWTGIMTAIDGADNATISNPWLAANIQQGHGPLGAAYPDVAYGMEGDTPSFLALIPNGLSVPDRPDWGGWGGRYALRIPPLDELDTKGFNGGVPITAETRPIWTNAVDKVTPPAPRPYGATIKPGERSFEGFRETIWRWRDDIQNDFAARMDWTVRAPGEANHPPLVRLGHPDRLSAKAGERVTLSAAGTRDPDGDSLSYHWFAYPEAGSCAVPIKLSGAESLYERHFEAPRVDRACDAHFILRVTDKGSPPLTRYARVIVTLRP